MADCSICDDSGRGPDPTTVSRRDFVRSVGAAALVTGLPLIGTGGLRAFGADTPGPTAKAPAETAVGRFYKTLSKEQKELICFPFDHPKRSQVQNNWAIVKPTIGEMTKEQQSLCNEIFKNLCSEEGYERFHKQMDDDAGGFSLYHVAVFGEPGGEKPFEWVLTGRHNTIRADGNSVEGVAFGGPIFYGHDPSGSGNDDAKHSGNVWWYQGEQANKLFKSLDDKQQAKALLDKGDPDAPRSIELKGGKLGEVGLGIAELDSQQKDMAKKLLKDLTSPFRAFDVAEVQECLTAAGGIDKLRLTYYKEGDIGKDGVWDIWKLEGPAFAWYFHGSPHVHTWVNIAQPAKA